MYVTTTATTTNYNNNYYYYYSHYYYIRKSAAICPTALPSGSAKCLRFGHWLNLCTLNMHLLTHLLTCLVLWVCRFNNVELMDGHLWVGFTTTRTAATTTNRSILLLLCTVTSTTTTTIITHSHTTTTTTTPVIRQRTKTKIWDKKDLCLEKYEAKFQRDLLKGLGGKDILDFLQLDFVVGRSTLGPVPNF